MANGGWYGTEEEWDRIEAPMRGLDRDLDDFARRHGLNVTRNARDWPDRSIRWGTDTPCLIQIFLVDEEKLTFNFWICASQDRADSRFWKQEMLCREAQMQEISDGFSERLEAGKTKLDYWSQHPEILEFATRLGFDPASQNTI
jgi:hypothetical protein